VILKLLMGGVIGAVLGTGVGYLGKGSGGTCPLTCNPVGGLLIGALIGAVLLVSTAVSAPEQPAVAAGTASASVVQIASPEQFDKIMKAGGVVLVDFFAEWCGPCKALKPTIHGIAEEYAGKVTVVAVNVDKVTALAERYKISSIPDVRLYKDGNEVQKFVGVKSKALYSGAIDKAIAKNGGQAASEAK